MGHAKVRQQHVQGLCAAHQDVGSPQVSVQHTKAMQVHEAGQDLDGDVKNLTQGKTTLSQTNHGSKHRNLYLWCYGIPPSGD